jgi:hypothetical protein
MGMSQAEHDDLFFRLGQIFAGSINREDCSPDEDRKH